MSQEKSHPNYYSEVYFNAFQRTVETIIKNFRSKDLKEELDILEDDNRTRIRIEKIHAEYKEKLQKELFDCFKQESNDSDFLEYLQESYEIWQKANIISQIEEIGGSIVDPGSIGQLEILRQNLKELQEFPKLLDYQPLG